MEIHPLCRVCLGLGEVPLETVWELEGCTMSLLQLLHSYTSIQYMDSWLPQHICSTCLQTVESAHNFSCQYRSSYEQLYEIIVKSPKLLHNVPKCEIELEVGENKSFGQSSENQPHIPQFNKVTAPVIDKLPEDNLKHKHEIHNFDKQDNANETVQGSEIYSEKASVQYYTTDGDNAEKLIEISEEQVQGILLGDNLEDSNEQCVGDNLTNVCPTCGLQLARKYSLRRHMAAAHGKMTMKCRECRKIFNNMTLFRGHKIKGCQNPVKTVRTVKKNRESIPVMNQLKCGICGKQFTTRNGFQYHMQRHDGPSQEHSCGTCARAFSTRAALANHAVVQHSSERPHLCPSCGRGFATTDHLRKHLRLVHGGRRDFLCVRCGQAFQQSSHLKQHLWVHTGIKPYICKQCGGGYSSKTSLKVHMAKLHKYDTTQSAFSDVIQDH